MRWEHTQASWQSSRESFEQNQELLDRLGNDGWELVAIDHREFRAIFKRPKCGIEALHTATIGDFATATVSYRE